MRALALLLGLLFGPALAALADVPPGVIELQVLRNADSRPAVGAVVTLNGHTSANRRVIRRESLANPAGRAQFEKLPLGSYHIAVQFAGHKLASGADRSVSIEAENPRASRVIRLSRKPVVTGIVSDADGRPLPHSRVELYRRQYSAWGSSLRESGAARTDDRGVYRIVLEEPGVVWVKASHSEISFPFGGGERTTGVVFAPNSPDLAGAHAVPLRFDQQAVQADVALPWAPDVAAAISVVSGKTGEPCRACYFQLLREEPNGLAYSIMDGRVSPQRSREEYGISAYGIPAGEYRLIVWERDGSGQQLLASSRFNLVEGQPQPYAVETAPMFPIAGRIVVEDALPETLGELREAGENAFQIVVSQAGQSRLGGVRNGQASVSLDEPYFEIGPAPPTRLEVEISSAVQNAYVAAITRQGRKTPGRLIDLSQGGDASDLVVHVGFDFADYEAQLSGSLDEGLAYRLRLTPVAPGLYRRLDNYCDTGEGVCRGSSAPPGRYRAVVLPGGPIDENDFYRPAFQAALRGWMREVELRPGDNPPFSLRPVPPEVLEEALAAF